MDIPIFIDFEASGFGVGSYPIEVGFAAANGAGWCSLIKPEDDWRHWDAQAAATHHISRAMLQQHGRTALAVAEQLNRSLAGCVVYTDGWMNDYIWMARLFDAAQRVPLFKLEDLRRIITLEQEACWHATQARVTQELHLTRHRASSDARIMQLTWVRSHPVLNTLSD